MLACARETGKSMCPGLSAEVITGIGIPGSSVSGHHGLLSRLASNWGPTRLDSFLNVELDELRVDYLFGDRFPGRLEVV